MNSTAIPLPTMPHARSVIGFLTKQRLAFGVSVRGAAILLALLAIYAGPVSVQSDVIGSIIVFALGGIVLSIMGLVALQGLSLKRSFDLKLLEPSSDTGVLVSGMPNVLTLKVSPFRIIPFLTLEVRLVFGDGERIIPSLSLTGRANEEMFVALNATFPHRGFWTVEKISCCLEDQLLLASYRWELNRDGRTSPLEVHPPKSIEVGLPILSSSQRTGDMVLDQVDRRGDPFDLRQYHPSDGLKKIVWKIFARRGELIARHPEPSVTPEGQVVLFVLASRTDDDVCSRAIAYAEMLDGLDLQIFCGCSGMRGLPTARTPAALETLLIESVWDSPSDRSRDTSTMGEIDGVLARFSEAGHHSKVDRLLLFCSESRLHVPSEAEHLAQLGSTLEQRGTTPVFCITRSPALTDVKRETVMRRLANILLRRERPERAVELPRNTETSSGFLSVCASRNWQAIMAD